MKVETHLTPSPQSALSHVCSSHNSICMKCYKGQSYVFIHRELNILFIYLNPEVFFKGNEYTAMAELLGEMVCGDAVTRVTSFFYICILFKIFIIYV